MDPRSCFFPSKDQSLLSTHQRWRSIAKLLKLSSQARVRLTWMSYHHTTAKGNVALTVRHFGIARKILHQWLHRFDETNLHSLESSSRRPHHTRRPQYNRLEEYRVIELRGRYPTAGREKLGVLYHDDYGEAIKPWAMRRSSMIGNSTPSAR